MLMTEFRYCWHLLNVGAPLCWKLEDVGDENDQNINISKLSPTHFVSNVRRQHRCNHLTLVHLTCTGGKNGKTCPFVWYKSFYVCQKEKRKSEMVKLLCLKNISTVSNHRLSDQSWLCNYIQTSPFYFLGENAIFSNILTSLPWLIDSLQKTMRHASFITLILLVTPVKTRRYQV